MMQFRNDKLYFYHCLLFVEDACYN